MYVQSLVFSTYFGTCMLPVTQGSGNLALSSSLLNHFFISVHIFTDEAFKNNTNHKLGLLGNWK